MNEATAFAASPGDTPLMLAAAIAAVAFSAL
jgi:hypothetical protein